MPRENVLVNAFLEGDRGIFSLKIRARRLKRSLGAERKPPVCTIFEQRVGDFLLPGIRARRVRTAQQQPIIKALAAPEVQGVSHQRGKPRVLSPFS